jgi:hypothetical protein
LLIIAIAGSHQPPVEQVAPPAAGSSSESYTRPTTAADDTEAYLIYVGNLSERVIVDNKTLSTLCGRAGAAGYCSPQQIPLIQNACDDLRSAAQESRRMSPPSSMRGAHHLFVSAMDEFDEAASDLPRAIAAGDIPAIHRCARHMDKGGQYATDAARQMNAVSPN